MKSADYFCSNPAHRQREWGTNRPDSITSVLMKHVDNAEWSLFVLAHTVEYLTASSTNCLITV